MTKRDPLSIFKGSQGHMYAVLLIVWDNYLQNLKDFQKKNAKKYTEQLGKDQQDAVKAARDMPDVATRREPSKEALVSLDNAMKAAANDWQDLSGYIEDTFPEAEWSTKKDAAGYANYEPAVHGSWDKVINLNNAATTFITDNLEALTNAGMPSSFPAQYAEHKQVYTDLYDALYSTRFSFHAETSEKALANYNAYTIAQSMMRDAKKIYRNNPRTRAGFTYSALMKLVSGKGFTKTGITFTVITVNDDGIKIPVTDATATFASAGKPVPANEKGKIKCLLSEGTYNYTITAPGMASVIGSVTISGGTMHQRKLTLKKGALMSATA